MPVVYLLRIDCKVFQSRELVRLVIDQVAEEAGIREFFGVDQLYAFVDFLVLSLDVLFKLFLGLSDHVSDLTHNDVSVFHFCQFTVNFNHFVIYLRYFIF